MSSTTESKVQQIGGECTLLYKKKMYSILNSLVHFAVCHYTEDILDIAFHQTKTIETYKELLSAIG